MLTAVWTPEGTQIKIVNNGHKQKIFWNGKSDESLVNLQGASEQTGQLKYGWNIFTDQMGGVILVVFYRL